MCRPGMPQVLDQRCELLKTLEDENAELKKRLEETMLDSGILKDVVSKNDETRREAGCSDTCPFRVWDEPRPGVLSAVG